MRELQTSFNPKADRVIEPQQYIQPVLKNIPVKDNTEAGRENSDMTPITDKISSLVVEKDQIVNNNQNSDPIDYIEPNNYDQAWNHKIEYNVTSGVKLL